MRVNLGRGDMAMAKELLDRADIVAVFKKLRRETVSQRVWAVPCFVICAL